jgi:hypothetical protein
MKEIWLPVVSYEIYYQISNLGNVRSHDRVIEYELKTKFGTKIVRYLRKSRNLKIHIGNNGYYYTDLQVNGERKTIAIHRLIADAFIPNPENKLTVNHIDGVKLNCSILNLEWATYSENNKHAIDIGLRKSPWTNKFGIDNPRSKPIIQLDKIGNVLNKYINAREAQQKTGVSYKHISSCCIGNRKTSGGYKWKFDVTV